MRALTLCIRPRKVDLDGDFEPSLLNSAIYLISLSMQVSTFAINYQGHPFRESLRENRTLYNGLVIVGGIAFCGATELFPEMNAWLQLVPFPPGFAERLTMAITLDFGVSYLIERISNYLFYNKAPKDIALRTPRPNKA
jgi:cation-transporting ATPase 13A1